MKGICGDAKQQINHCMFLGDSENGIGIANGNANENFIGASPVHRGGRTFRSRQVSSLAIRNTSSYDTMERPFRPDNLRGRWSKSVDFYFASSSFAFSTMAFSDVPVWALMFGGWKFYLSAYLLSVCFYSLPIFLIQTFLGQFSTSGAISAFRVSPIFKGIGYSILLLNLGTLTYYSVNAAVPLIYAVNSLHSVMPWMSCNNSWNSPQCSTHDSYDEESDADLYPHSTVEYFHSMIGSIKEGSSDFSLSWSMVVAILGIWFVVLVLLVTRVSIIGKALRCACVLMFGFFLSVFVYMVIHEQVGWRSLLYYLHPAVDSWEGIWSSLGTAILQASMILGPGWGSVITLGSYNSFRTDAERKSVWVSITHVIITVMAIICGHVANDHFEDHVAMWHVEKKHTMQFTYVAYAYLFGSFTTLPKLWSFLFFVVIFLSEMCALIIQMMSVLTALFDEFEVLHKIKRQVTIILVLCLTSISVYFCTQLGFSQVSALSYIALFTQIIFSALLILMTTWIYGRVRFQCDLQFMLGKTISESKIFAIRFIAPCFIALALWELSIMLVRSNADDTLIWFSQGFIYLFVVGYMIYKLSQTNGTWRQRMRQCFAPHDWHPVSADNRRFYEEIMGNSEMLVFDNGNAT
ncbi:sodium- and chloride-dependent glycine transporter 1 [Drosophila innubila]|uniref:sodium- and chloride-dependent glycine transporter 1 n=1 Tax=Drosophila innubila TaxID=198719 RepID=UPI00148CDE1B|nr:sodium- and chloride-dependent glycine transporter 1 [Drosophila innubila]XP_034474100.1 sodium- and chloride-dependent glycine transporter 1 [Drosophila innubila]XP_034474101.1 sodium- and chloride-dependent glycine transporter 1 [Drosophila innubila]